MRKPITNLDVINEVQEISDALEGKGYASDLSDFILNYIIGNTDDIQLMWNDSVEEST